MSNRLKELREKRAKLITEARERLDLVTNNTDESRAAELETQHDAAMAEVERIEAQIQREQRMADLEDRAAREDEERRDRRRPREPGNERPAGDDVDGREITYRDAFHAMLRVGGAVYDLSPEHREVLRRGTVDLNNPELRTQLAGTPAAGGYTVPTELAGFIDKALKDWGPMYDQDICTVLNTGSGNPFKIPTIDDTNKSAGAHTEGQQLTDDGSEDVVFGQQSLEAYVFDTEWIRWSFELAQDSAFGVEGLLGQLLGERLGRKANAQLTIGTGVNQPNGIVTASSLGVTAAAVAAVTSDELIDLQHSVNQAYRRSPKCRWMFADSTLKAIRKLKDAEGRYIWQMGDIRVGAPDVLLDKPYSINDDVPAIATGNKAIVFGDFSRFYVRKVGSPVIGVVRERYWPDLGIAGLVRIDSEVGQSGAIKHLKLA